MKKSIDDLAVFGGGPLLEKPLPVGQMNMPSWEGFRERMQGILDRRYYTNHGVLAQEFEERLCGILKVRNAVTITNATIGISLAALAMGMKGKVIVPAFTSAATAQALEWIGLEPAFCDVNPFTHAVSVETVEAALERHPDATGVLGVHLWGNACDTEGLGELAKRRGLSVFYDAAHAFGCTHGGRSVGTFGDCEIFSFHATKVLNSCEGGCVATNDDDLAERIRNLRSSYGRRRDVEVPVNANGRFSEFQAAFGLLSLDDFEANCARNTETLERYRNGLGEVPGLRMILPDAGERHNCQYAVFEVDADRFGIDRDHLADILGQENILARKCFTPGLHRCVPFSRVPQPDMPVTDDLCRKVIQLPSGSMVGPRETDSVIGLVRFIHENAQAIGRKA